jgi:two-component system response regulator MprA
MAVSEGPRILLAEDDRATRSSLVLALELEGYRVRAVGDGEQALAQIAAEGAEVILLDVMMPFIDGLTVCRRLRSHGDLTPVLMLTARTEIADRVSGLDAGADDYLVKPFALDELFARVRALVRRNRLGDEHPVVELADLRLDPASRQAWRGQRELHLTKTEFDLLELLASNAGTVLTHGTIYDRIWGYDFGGESKNLAVYIGYLRRKLEEGGENRLLHTIRGIGYTMRQP